MGVNLKSNIEDVIREHEPRVDVRRIDVIVREDENEIMVNIYFNIKNEPEVVSLTTTLQRTR